MTESLTTMNMLQICALKQVKKLILNIDNNLYHAQRRQCKIKNILIHTSDTALTTLCMNFHVYRALRKQHRVSSIHIQTAHKTGNRNID